MCKHCYRFFGMITNTTMCEGWLGATLLENPLIMKLPVLLVVFLIILIKDVQATSKSGPYNIIVTRLEQCDDPGTDEIHFGIRMNSKGNNLKTYTNDVVFAVPWDDQVKLDMEARYLRNGAYVPKFIQQSLKNCEKAWTNLKHLTQELFKAAGYNFTGCPLPAGTYSVKDWVVDLKLNNVPSLMYGSYKIIISFLKKGKRIGCFTMYLDAVPIET